MRWKRGIGRKGFDDLDGAMVGRIRNCEGRRVRRGYLWQGGAKISQYRAEQGGAKHPSNRLLLFLSAILILFFCPIFLFSIFTKAAAGE